MIKYETYDDGRIEFACAGVAADLFADTMILIKMVYDTIKEQKDKEEAEIFKNTVITALSDPECPIYEEDVFCEG